MLPVASGVSSGAGTRPKKESARVWLSTDENAVTVPLGRRAAGYVSAEHALAPLEQAAANSGRLELWKTAEPALPGLSLRAALDVSPSRSRHVYEAALKLGVNHPTVEMPRLC
ncbi:hypothetical protein GCM10028793_21820 [Nocardiopsis oceani]